MRPLALRMERFLMLVPFLKTGTMVLAQAIQLVIFLAENSAPHRLHPQRIIFS